MTAAQLGIPESIDFSAALTRLVDSDFAARLFAGDPTIWGPEAEAEAAQRLGWTDFEAHAREAAAAAAALRETFAANGVDRIVLCGMGGSSLAPLVMSPALTVLDSTHPDAVRDALAGDLARTAVVVSSKSGGTVETLSHRAAFTAAFTEAGIDPAERIVIVTDPGSALEHAAAAAGERVFLADPEVGGRFSALTAFGIVPSVLSGADVLPLIDDATAMREALLRSDAMNPALRLAAAIFSELPGRYVLEVTGDGTLPAPLGLWIEQLIAESTGKSGIGVLPIARSGGPGDATSAAIARGVILGSEGMREDSDAFRVSAPLGAQFFLWEVVTAALGFLMGIDPFNQPDVEAAKIAAREQLGSAVSLEVSDERSYTELVEALTELLPDRGYLAIQAFAFPGRAGAEVALERLRGKLAETLDAPVSAAWGPRYLHSTGQLHKGGPSSAAFLQLIELAAEDLAIPGSESSFGQLIAAQSIGDAAVLRDRGRGVLTIVTRDLPALLAAFTG